MKPFDHIVLTAANEGQARGYRIQVDCRRREGFFHSSTDVHVVPDPGGRRVGSLGATLHALRHLAGIRRRACPSARDLSDLFRGQRVLLCHSGGDSRRLPAYAAQGKVFAPMPTLARNGQPAALFDLILANMERLPAPADGHVVVISGDVLLTFDARRLALDGRGVVGVACAAPLSRGMQHGVYVVDGGMGQPGLAEVAGFLQKPDEVAARAAGAVGAADRVLVDTGILSLDAGTVGRLLGSAGVTLRGRSVATGPGLVRDLERGRCAPMDIYEELCLAIPRRAAADGFMRYVERKSPDVLYRRRARELFRASRGIPFHVNVVPDCEFFHIGSSRELLANLSMMSRTSQEYGFANYSQAAVSPGAALEGGFVFNSILATSRVRGSGSLIEACHSTVPLLLGEANILVGLPASAGRAVRLRDGLGIVCLPVGSTDWAVCLFGIEDDFKGGRGSPAGCRFLNRPIDDWLSAAGIRPGAVWADGVKQDLWQARLWGRGDVADGLRAAEWMQAPSGAAAARGWANRRRYSMAELMGMVDHERLVAHREDIRRHVGLRRLAERMGSGERVCADAVAAAVRGASDATCVYDQVASLLRSGGGPLERARVWQLASTVAVTHRPPRPFARAFGPSSARDMRQAALGAVSDAISRSVDLPARARPAAIMHDQVVWVTTPVRIDFAGGWSDTPPICTELGGTVLNAAITLNGQYPIQVVAKLNEDRLIRLSSIDLGCQAEIRTTEELLDHRDPTQWAALPKAALVLAGMGPSRPGESLKRWLDTLGGGLDLTIFSAVPKGSGLGTSSILGSAVLACLGRVLGGPVRHEDLVSRTSVLEQLMTTGGGWQDQVGGIIPGVKLIQTQPGLSQAVSLKWAVFDMQPGTDLRSRLLLYYTGQKRMARDILHNVVARYLGHDPATLDTIRELKASAEQTKADLDARDVDAFARGIDRYWELKKRIDPGSTNEAIEMILKRVRPWLSGRLLPGAGGGGFIFMVARDAAAAARIRRTLQADPPNRTARFFDFDVDADGLNVSVL